MTDGKIAAGAPAGRALPARLLRVIAWALLLGIIFSTLSPIWLRPESGLPANDERFAAFLLLSFVFTLAYPHRLMRVVLAVAAVAIVLEALQLVDPTRHARLYDLIVKLVGGGLGAGIGGLVLWWLGRAGAVAEPAEGKAPSPGLPRNPTSPPRER